MRRTITTHRTNEGKVFLRNVKCSKKPDHFSPNNESARNTEGSLKNYTTSDRPLHLSVITGSGTTTATTMDLHLSPDRPVVRLFLRNLTSPERTSVDRHRRVLQWRFIVKIFNPETDPIHPTWCPHSTEVYLRFMRQGNNSIKFLDLLKGIFALTYFLHTFFSYHNKFICTNIVTNAFTSRTNFTELSQAWILMPRTWGRVVQLISPSEEARWIYRQVLNSVFFTKLVRLKSNFNETFQWIW